MDGAQTGLCGGCWRAILLSTCVLLHLIPLCVHGNSLGSNATQSDDKTNGSSPCLGCQGDEGTAGVGEQAAPVTGSAWPFALGLRAARLPRENREELGSGEGAVGVLGESSTTAPLSQGGGTATMGVTEISPDSAEKDHVMEVVPAGGTLPNSEVRPDDKGQQQEERPWHTDPPWQSSDKELAQQPQSASPAHPPSLPPPDVLTVDYYDPSVRAHKLPPPSPEPAAHELQGQPTAWTLPDGYDYLTPYEDSYSTTEVYPDEDQFTTADLMDENDPRLTSSPPTSMLTPEEVLVLLSGTQDEEPPPLAPGTAEFSNETECRPGYIRHNASCRSHCDFFPSYCFNGGQCYLVEGTGVFCRCNVQDYIWHKGSRCESVVTEFQVLCLAVGAAALMVLLLFMITVFFAKKLHLLKTENSKLRKRSSKYRPPSEQHNDNFSLSTIAEGSHPNKTMSRYTWECKTKEEPDCQDDPNAQNKLEDPVKAPPPKDEEPLNIQNSLTPKHENNKASSDDSAEAGVTIDVELHIPKHATVLPPASPPMRYNVYLYKVPRSPGPRRGYDPQSTQSLPPLPSKRPHSRLDKACTP